MARGAIGALLLLLAAAAAAPRARALRFYLHDRERRCFKFDAPFATRIIGEGRIVNGKGTAVLAVDIRAPDGSAVFETSRAESGDAKFAFMSPNYAHKHHGHDEFDEYDYEPYEVEVQYTACLMLTFDDLVHTPRVKRAVSFWIRPDVDKKSATHASNTAVDTVQTTLRAAHATLGRIAADLSNLQQREHRLVKKNQVLANRVFVLAIASLIVLVVTAVVQVKHFAIFFKRKKLL